MAWTGPIYWCSCEWLLLLSRPLLRVPLPLLWTACNWHTHTLVRSVVLLSVSMAARWPSCASLTSELAEDELSTSRKRQKSSTATSNVHKPLHCLSMPHIQVPFPLFYLFLKMVSRHLNALYFPMTPFCPFAFWALMVNTEWHSIVEMATETLVVWSPRVYLCMNYRLLWLHGANIVHQLAPFFFFLCVLGKAPSIKINNNKNNKKAISVLFVARNYGN